MVEREKCIIKLGIIDRHSSDPYLQLICPILFILASSRWRRMVTVETPSSLINDAEIINMLVGVKEKFLRYCLHSLHFQVNQIFALVNNNDFWMTHKACRDDYFWDSPLT